MLLVVFAAAATARLAGNATKVAMADASAEAIALGAALGVDSHIVARANNTEILSIGSAKKRALHGHRSKAAPEGAIDVFVSYRGALASASAVPGTARDTDAALAGRTLTGGGGNRDGLAPATIGALSRADRILAERGHGSPVPVVSGYRSMEQQMALWARRATNPYPVAPPGRSAHNRGLAIDVPKSWVAALKSVAAEAGLCQPFPGRDPIHFGPVESPECSGGARGRAGRIAGIGTLPGSEPAGLVDPPPIDPPPGR